MFNRLCNIALLIALFGYSATGIRDSTAQQKDNSLSNLNKGSIQKTIGGDDLPGGFVDEIMGIRKQLGGAVGPGDGDKATHDEMLRSALKRLATNQKQPEQFPSLAPETSGNNQSKANQAVEMKVETQKVLFAKKDIAIREKLTEENCELKEIIKAYALDGAVASLEEVNSKFANNRIRAGMQIPSDYVSDAVELGTLAIPKVPGPGVKPIFQAVNQSVVRQINYQAKDVRFGVNPETVESLRNAAIELEINATGLEKIGQFQQADSLREKAKEVRDVYRQLIK